MRWSCSHLLFGLGFLALLVMGNAPAWSQSSEPVQYSGWDLDNMSLRCGGCMVTHRCSCPISFYPIQSLHSCKTDTRPRILPKNECNCINKAISTYAQVWVNLQSGDMSPETAMSKLTLHLECTDYCDRWEDCENLLRFIDQEVAKQRSKPGPL